MFDRWKKGAETLAVTAFIVIVLAGIGGAVAGAVQYAFGTELDLFWVYLAAGVSVIVFAPLAIQRDHSDLM